MGLDASRSTLIENYQLRHEAKARRGDAPTSTPPLIETLDDRETTEMFLQTNHADAKFNGDHIVLTIPSGTDRPQVAMSVHQALSVAAILMATANKVMREANRDSELIAEIIPLRRSARQ